ncbi:MAG: hypothetical protein IJI41_06570 [Anaerolineaceae bacterium]|nr:hypothetical protein [Anaerolineaceae bacterium]
MNLIWSIPVGVLLAAALFVFLINRGHPNIGAAWFAAMFAGLFVWGWTVSLYFRPDVQIPSISDSVPGILEEAGVFLDDTSEHFVLDGISYPYMLAISSLLVILLMTAPSYMEPESAPRIWFFYLLIEAIGYLSVSANNVKYIIYGWVVFDGLDLITQYLQVRPEQIRKGFLIAIGVRFAGTLLAAASLALSDAELGNTPGAFISLKAGAYLLTACALRMGIFPISQPYSEMSRTRVGLGTMLRLVSVLTVMPILSRIPMGGLRPDLRFVLGVASAFASLAGAVGWLLSENSFTGVSYAALAICGMVFNSALSNEQSVMMVWGVSVVLTCAPLSLYQVHNRVMNFLALMVVLSFSGLPYTPNAFGWFGLVRSPDPVRNVIFVLIPMLLIAGAVIHILRTEGRKFSELEPWMRSIYPLGFLTAVGTHMFIGMTSFDERFSLGVIPASAVAFAGGIFLAVSFIFMPESRKTQNSIAWGRAGMSFFWRGMQKVMDMDWLITLSGWLGRFLRWTLMAFSSMLENNSGLVWEFLILALLIAAAFSGGGL